MKKIGLLIICCLITVPCLGAELLVKAKPSWNGKGKEVGDVVVVRPNGHVWGKSECLPSYIVIKIPDLSYEDAKKYEEGIYEKYIGERGIEKVRRVKNRKYKIKKTTVDSIKLTGNSKFDVKKEDKDLFISNIKDKSK